VYLTAVVAPIVAVVVVAVWKRGAAEMVLLTVGVSLSLVASIALVAYMLSTGQFPPRLGRADVQLPAEDVEDTATSLHYLKETLTETINRVDDLERRVPESQPRDRGEE
jgi:hypothetical protein